MTPPTSLVRPLVGLLAAASLTTLILGMSAGPALADELVAADATPAVTTSSAIITAPTITAAATTPGGIVVANHGGQVVRLFAKGERIRRVDHPGLSPVRFTGLTPGRTYTVEVGGVRVGSLTAITRPTAASGLTVRTTAERGAVALAWRHRPSIATGGRSISYVVTATSRTAPTVRDVVSARRSTTLRGLDRHALYTFTVVPRNGVGTGKGTRAVMTRTLADLVPDAPVTTASAAPVVEPPTPEPTPATTSAPTPAASPAPPPTPSPATRTIYVCPTGFTETSSGACQTTLPYTFSTLDYTFHTEATGPAPLLTSYETANVCAAGYNLEDYGWVKYCRLYGPAPTATVKDATPAGYSDNGTAWVKKDDAPAGYTDDGTQWAKVVAKEARIVPA